MPQKDFTETLSETYVPRRLFFFPFSFQVGFLILQSVSILKFLLREQGQEGESEHQ